ncbi:MAG: hypothetical protein ACO262_08890 [Vulcanococcus sp.]
MAFKWMGSVYDSHPVLQAMRHELHERRQRYQHQPCEFNRYQLVRIERRIAEACPDLLSRG